MAKIHLSFLLLCILSLSFLDRAVPFIHAQTVSYTYDTGPNGIGRLSRVNDTTGSTTFEYDLRGNVSKTSKVIETSTYVFESTYDSLNRLVDLTYPDGEIMRHSYNAQGLLEKIQSLTLGTFYLKNLDYNALDQITVKTLGNDLTTDYDYFDTLSEGPTSFRLRNITTRRGTDPPLQNLSYIYDAIGNVRTIVDTIGENDQSFDYDALDRLSTASSPESPVYSSVYAYNTIGNMESGAGNVLSYPQAGAARPHAAISDGSFTYGYDENGNLFSKTSITTGDTRSFFWDSENRLVRIENNGTFLASFAYDHEGRKVRKTFNDGSQTKYVGDLYECTASGCSKFVFAGFERITQIVSGTTEYRHGDHLGSASLVTAANGAVMQQISYYPFGKTRNDSSPLMGVSHRYTDQEWDFDLGLYDYGARYYDPDLMRFISADPIGVDLNNPQTLNRYSYVLNNPLKYTDPTGNTPFLFLIPPLLAILNEWLSPSALNGPALPNDGLVNRDSELELLGKNLGGAVAGQALVSGGVKAFGQEIIEEVVGVPSDVGDLVKGAKGLWKRGIKPALGTRVRPEGVPEGWRIRSTRGKGGTEYYNPKNPNESIRVMQGDPNSNYPNSQAPYARQRNAGGTYYRSDGNLSSGRRGGLYDGNAHIPLDQFRVR